VREGNDDNEDGAGDDGDYGYDNEKAGEPGHNNNADDYGDKHDVLYLALI
jgi:hypothetical protein